MYLYLILNCKKLIGDIIFLLFSELADQIRQGFVKIIENVFSLLICVIKTISIQRLLLWCIQGENNKHGNASPLLHLPFLSFCL